MVLSISSFSFTNRCSSCNQEKQNVLSFEVVNISRRSMVSNRLSTRVPMIFSRIVDAGNRNDCTVYSIVNTLNFT